MNEFTEGREPVTVIEIDQDFCEHRYGTAPCAAQLGITGEAKCYNTRRTCQDPENYSPIVKTLHFCKPGERIPEEVYCIPSVASVSTAPTVINPGGGDSNKGPLGTRASVRVVFNDHPHSDHVVDPYVAERGHDPMQRGTFWSKWLARNPYYNNRVIRIREGYQGQALADMVTRTYLIDKIDGPNQGRVTITAKDVLKLADNDKAQAPRPSRGELLQDYADDEEITALRITGAEASEYPAPGTVRVNDELMTYTGVTTISPSEIQLTGITRATDGSELGSHDAGDRVQLCLRYTRVRPDILAYEWLTEYGDVPQEWIPLEDWEAEASLWLLPFEMTGLVTEPTGVDDLLSEITEQALFYIWWDERAQLIRLAALKPPIFEDVPQIDDDRHIIGGSAAVAQDPQARVSQVWVFWGQRNPTEKLDKESNYRRLRVRADLEAESPAQYGEQRIRKIFSRWISSEAQAVNLSVRLLNRYRNNPRSLTLALDAKDRHFWTGDVVDVTHRSVVDFSGAPVQTRYQILSAEETEPGHTVEYRLEVYEYGPDLRFGRWMAVDSPDYEDATPEERLTGAWWADEDGKVNGNDGYRWV